MSFSPRECLGVFDSGLGGLTGLRRLRALAPSCDVVYFGDTARVPYGTRDTETLVRFAHEDVEFLRAQGATRVLVACGTISSVLPAAEWAKLPLPCQGVVNAASQAALAATCNGRVGVLATPATVRSGSYARCMAETRPGLLTVAQACPAFVPLIEAGKTDGPELEAAAREYLAPLLAAGCDTVILGCTHYPLIAPLLSRLMPGVRLIDSAGEAAAVLVRGMGPCSGSGRVRCFVSGDAASFSARAGVFLGEPLAAEHVERRDAT